MAPETQMMLHVALGGQNDESVAFIDQMSARSVHFDVIWFVLLSLVAWDTR